MLSHGSIALAFAQTERRRAAPTTRTRIRESPASRLDRRWQITISSQADRFVADQQPCGLHVLSRWRALARSGRLRLSKRHQIILR
jgi:hypothetical protein